MTESDYPYTAFVGTKWPNTFWRILQTTQRRCPLHTVFSLILCLFIKEDKCTYKPELAAAFVKNVVNITAVGHLWKQWFLGLSVGRMELKKKKNTSCCCSMMRREWRMLLALAIQSAWPSRWLLTSCITQAACTPGERMSQECLDFGCAD